MRQRIYGEEVDNRITIWNRGGGFQPPSQTWNYGDAGNTAAYTYDHAAVSNGGQDPNRLATNLSLLLLRLHQFPSHLV